MIDEIKEKFIEESHEYYEKTGYNYWDNHVKYVFDIALSLADEVGADKMIVGISAILHDIARIYDDKETIPHNIKGAKIAEDKLKKYNLDKKILKRIKDCILRHSGKFEKTLSKEQWCIRNADIISNFYNMSLYYYNIYAESKLNYEEGKQLIKKIVTNKYNSLDPKLQERYKEQYNNIYSSI